MGEIVGDSAVLWKLLESEDSVLPSDERGVFADLRPPSGVTRPAVVLGGVTGFGRLFTGIEHIEADDSGSVLKLTRSMTVQFIVAFDLTAQDTAGVPGTLLSYGFRDASPAEDLHFLVELDSVDEPSKRANIRMRWETNLPGNPGAIETNNIGADFIFPHTAGGTPEKLLITVVREWRTDTDVIVRYYANDLFLGKDNSTEGTIAGIEGATMIMGARGDGAGAYENRFEGTLEAVAIFDRVMTAEEIRQISRLIAIHGPAGYEMLKELLPEGVYSNDPSSFIQSELVVEGQITGRVLSKAAELVEDFLPDRAWSSLADWERVLRLPPNPGDTLAARRNRLLSFLKANEGHTIGGVKNALVPTFDLLASQIEILEFTEILEDGFLTGIADFWAQFADGHTIAQAAGALKITASSGTHHRWDIVAGDHAPHLKCNIDRDELETDAAAGSEASVLIDSESLATDDETLAGIAMYDQAGNNVIIYGIYATGGGTITLGSVKIVNGVQAAIVSHGAAPARPFYLNIKHIGFVSYALGTAAAGDQDTVTPVTTVSGPGQPAFVLLGLFGLVAGGPTAADALDFDTFRLFTPLGLRVFNWYAFRDPALSGTPDIPGARKVVDRIKPAHTQAAAVQTKALLCDDPDSLCDDGPLG